MTLQAGSQSSHPMLSHTDGLASLWRDFILLVARVLLGLVFVIYGWEQIIDLPKFAETFPARGLSPWIAYVAGPVDFIGGLALVFGLGTRYAALVMFLFVITAAVSSHPYWSVLPAQVGNQRAHFWKCISMLGGCLALFVAAGGRFSLDHILSRRKN